MPLRIIADASYFETRAEMLRRGWAAEERRRRVTLAHLRARLRERGAIKRVAHELGVSRSTLDNVLHGRRPPTALMMRELGGER